VRFRYVRGQVLFGADGARPGDGDTVRLVEPTLYDSDGAVVPFHFRHLSHATDSLAVRLLGVDTPEETYAGSPLPGHGMPNLPTLAPHPPQQEPWAGRAKHFTDQFLSAAGPGERVTVELDQQLFDRFGRVLGYLYVGQDPRPDCHLNLQLLAAGWATLYQVHPNLLHLDAFGRAVESARAAGRGLWPDLEDQRVLGVDEIRQRRALNPPFVYRKVIDASIAGVSVEEAFRLTGRWVGNRQSRQVFPPAAWASVPHALRVFFDQPTPIQALGYRRV
jgi:endonuclease YncB( thermonuclease family)